MATKKPADVDESVVSTPEPEAIETATAVLPELMQIEAKKVIPRASGVDIVPGQRVWMPRDLAMDAIKAGEAINAAKAD